MFGEGSGPLVFDRGPGDNEPNPCELIMAAPEDGGAAVDGLSNGLSPAGCIPLWGAWGARLIDGDEKACFDRLEDYFGESPDKPGAPEGSTLGYVGRDGGCAVASIVACALATEIKSVGGGSWKPQAALPVPEGVCPRTKKRYTVKSFHTGAISLRKAVADMVSTSTLPQKEEWWRFLGPLYETKKTGAVSDSHHANVDLESPADAVDLFTSDFRKKSEHVGGLGLAMIALAIGRAIRAHTAPLTGAHRFTDYGEGGPFIHIVFLREHYYPALPRGRLPIQAAISMCATTEVPGKSTAVEPLGESTAVAELAIADAAGPEGVGKSPAEGATTSKSASGSPPISGAGPPSRASFISTGMLTLKFTAPHMVYMRRRSFNSPSTPFVRGVHSTLGTNMPMAGVHCLATAAGGPSATAKPTSTGGPPTIFGAGTISKAEARIAGMLTFRFTAQQMVYMIRRSFNRPSTPLCARRALYVRG